MVSLVYPSILFFHFASKDHIDGFFRTFIDAAITHSTVVIMRNTPTLEDEILIRTNLHTHAASSAVIVNSNGLIRQLFDCGHQQALGQSQQTTEGVKATSLAFAAIDIFTDFLHFSVGSIHAFLDGFMARHGEDRYVINIVGHEEMLGINDADMTLGKQRGECSCAITGKNELSAKYDDFFSAQSVYMFYNKFSHDARHTGHVDRIAKGDSIAVSDQTAEIYFFFNGMAGGG